MDPLDLSSDSEESHRSGVVVLPSSLSFRWLSIVQKLAVNLLFPFVNGVMLGFGEILAHELGLVWGWRSAKVYDPTAVALATNPRARRSWLFGLA